MIAAPSQNADRISKMMARRKTLNPNERKMPQGIDPSAVTNKGGRPGIVGRGGNFQAHGKAAMGRMPPQSGPIMAPDQAKPYLSSTKPTPMPPGGMGGGGFPGPGSGGIVGDPMKPDIGMDQMDPGYEMKSISGAPMGGGDPMLAMKPGMMPPGGPGSGGIVAQPMPSGIGGPAAMPGGGMVGQANPNAGMGIPPEILQRLQAMQGNGAAGAPGQPGPGFVPPGQGAPGGAPAPRPYGLQSFYGA